MQPIKKTNEYEDRLLALEKELRQIIEHQNDAMFELPKIDYEHIEFELNALISEIQSRPPDVKQALDPVLKKLRTTVEDGRHVILKHMETLRQNIDHADINKKAIHAYTKSMTRPTE